MQILMSGSKGLIGSALCEHWQQQHTIHSISIFRNKTTDQRHWGSPLALAELPPLDVVVHLAGAGIADKRWSKLRKQTILDSRLSTTHQLVDEILKLEHKPKVVLCASAIGYYGDRDNELLDEASSADVNFSSQLCQAWEASCQPLIDAGIRVVKMRFGVVLSAKGGALSKMLPAFRTGVGGRMGTGKQWMSWIAIDDVLGAIDHVLAHQQISGPVNMTAPNPVQNQEFSQTLAKTLHRPCLLPMPAIAIKVVFGEMGQELLLGGARVAPTVLLDSGYDFKYPTLDKALQTVIGE